jgi:dipeptidase D
MDSEEDGAFYIGCSGGVDTIGELKLSSEKIPADSESYEIMVTGLKGGHSGLDIIQGRGNAIKILGRALKKLEEFNFTLSFISGGSLRNAIPREADAIISIPKESLNDAQKIIKDFEAEIKNEFKTVDSGVLLIFQPAKTKQDSTFTKEVTDKIVHTIMALPHGVMAMSADIAGLVETSTNLATIKVEGDKIYIGTSQRSSLSSAKHFVAGSVASVFNLAGFEFKHSDGYPGWKPNVNSKLLEISKKVFKDLFKKEPKIKAIHAGLECGIIESKNPGMDMISFGPTIQNAHSPDEKIEIETVERFYDLLRGILKELAK